MMFGLPKDASITDLVKAARKAYASRVPPVMVKTGPVKENILKGDDIDLFDFPVPRWHRLDGGRYINTMQGSVTRDPVSGRMNVGIYRGMIGKKDTIPVLLWRPQNWGQDMQKYADKQPGDAGRVHLWLGAVPAVLRVVADPAGRFRIRRDGRDARRAGGTGRLRDGAAAGAGERRDRDRGLDFDRSRRRSRWKARSANTPAISAATRRPSTRCA